MLINNVPTVVEIEATKSLPDSARTIHPVQFTEMREFEHVPLSSIQSWSPLSSSSPLFNTLVVYDHRDLNGTLRSFGPEWEHRDLELLENTGYPLTLLAFGTPNPWVRLQYDRQSVDAQIAAQILTHLEQLLDQFSRSPDSKLGNYVLLGEAERRLVVHEFNDTRVDYPQDETLDSMFRDQVERTPEKIAIIAEDKSWTYRELSDRASAVASALVEAGVGRETIVGVMVERSCEMMAAILGVIRAGCAYLPLNPEDPSARLAYMLETASADIVLVQQHLREKLEDIPAKIANRRRIGMPYGKS